MTTPTDALPTSVQRVREALAQAGLDVTILMLDEAARTSQQAADALTRLGGTSVELGQIAKSLVFRAASGRGVLVIASGAARVDEAKVAAALGEPIGRADAAFVRDATGYAIGGVPPIGHATAMRVLLDRKLLAYRTVWAAAGHPHSMFEASPQALFDATGGQVADVALDPA